MSEQARYEFWYKFYDKVLEAENMLVEALVDMATGKSSANPDAGEIEDLQVMLWEVEALAGCVLDDAENAAYPTADKLRHHIAAQLRAAGF